MDIYREGAPEGGGSVGKVSVTGDGGQEVGVGRSEVEDGRVVQP